MAAAVTGAGAGGAELERALRRINTTRDGDIDLAEAALALALIVQPEADLASYRRHLAGIVGDVAAQLAEECGEATLAARIAALNVAIGERRGYRGDRETYDDAANADLIRVIDRRKGLPVALGILYLHAARGQGWRIDGLNFPGHFLVRLDRAGERVILDPFRGGAVVAAEELRRLLKAGAGPEAELRPDHYEPLGNRDILLRLQNNLRRRLVRDGEVRRAIAVTESMLLIAPGKAALWREAGLLYAELGEVEPAITALERFLGASASDAARHQAAALLQRLRTDRR